ncbi:MAG: prepilin-type N-terminal cleavage/methylation domain-containing protein [Actinomycetota bacterium]|nr:prepilin-type N-terminal cleavage/methylation domain-containing protein [Actinomycetota bacterium]
MIRKLFREESGYSLVEVMVSIFILTAAIIPMVGMFDMGLKTATTSGNYDTARAFANTKLEQAKSLSYTTVKDQFPGTSATPSNITLTPGSSPTISTDPDVSSNFPTVPSDFRYSVSKRYLTLPNPDATATNATLTDGGSTDLTGIIELTVTVRWGSDNSYSTTGVVSRDAL